MRRARRTLLLATTAVLCLPLLHCAINELGTKPVVDFNGAAWKARRELITRAKVFVRSPPTIASLDFSRPPNNPHPLDPGTPLECRYVRKPTSATTPKFDCELPTGQLIKVKYGSTPERAGEVAATGLLAALGFGADHVTMLPKLRCRGCPYFPFQMRRIAEWFFATGLLDALTDDDAVREFTWVSAEQKLSGRAIEVPPHQGWDWDELELVDPAKGGATRAELDALRLMAVFLSHWDNKATNQRVLCEPGPGGSDPTQPCAAPLLMIQDMGATFGPRKVQHPEWAAMPIWADEAKCIVSLEKLPYRGLSFKPAQILEPGRALLADKLRQLTEAQIRALFQAARFPDPASGEVTGDVSMWVRTFQDKVRQIVDRPACPSAPPN